ncbi:MAG TPA: Rieske (2Fe-2S) protein [Mycobacteriales bacterium]|jgi:nitrite reductase/ring-hydroxylating ferredoxin subunit|nr:Rieske (2Fe-2S) protein [Mycobacteriales bacterium]
MSRSVPASTVPPGQVTGVDRYAVGDNGTYFAVGRRCRHLRADLAEGSIDSDGCLVCPWHAAKYDVTTGRMVRGPQGAFAKVPGLDAGYVALTRAFPLKRAPVVRRGEDLIIE